jgi:hypothetical protein
MQRHDSDDFLSTVGIEFPKYFIDTAPTISIGPPDLGEPRMNPTTSSLFVMIKEEKIIVLP